MTHEELKALAMQRPGVKQAYEIMTKRKTGNKKKITHGQVIAKILEKTEARFAYENPEPELVLFRIIMERQRSGLTTAEVAKRMGVPESVVLKIESPRRRKCPPIEVMYEYAKACDGALNIKFIPGKKRSPKANAGK